MNTWMQCFVLFGISSLRQLGGATVEQNCDSSSLLSVKTSVKAADGQSTTRGPVAMKTKPEADHVTQQLLMSVLDSQESIVTIDADNSACPSNDPCGLEASKGCAKCPATVVAQIGCECKVPVPQFFVAEQS
eukprot:TRINITY_DN3241_c2_g3_i1.p1 TRINITY_DN3241_c2_g3~~TRINITY_DN3241_c2_g3_i1.p1  ORF type:complete len:132 (+),score=24.51 TRINITY_DN3241_c2_g3_i1:176-571(+)